MYRYKYILLYEITGRFWGSQLVSIHSTVSPVLTLNQFTFCELANLIFLLFYKANTKTLNFYFLVKACELIFGAYQISS